MRIAPIASLTESKEGMGGVGTLKGSGVASGMVTSNNDPIPFTYNSKAKVVIFYTHLCLNHNP